MNKPSLPHNPTGYLSGRPFQPDRWAEIGAGQPEGRIMARYALPSGAIAVA